MKNNDLEKKKNELEEAKRQLGQLEDSSKSKLEKLTQMEENIKKMGEKIVATKNNQPEDETYKKINEYYGKEYKENIQKTKTEKEKGVEPLKMNPVNTETFTNLQKDFKENYNKNPGTSTVGDKKEKIEGNKSGTPEIKPEIVIIEQEPKMIAQPETKTVEEGNKEVPENIPLQETVKSGDKIALKKIKDETFESGKYTPKTAEKEEEISLEEKLNIAREEYAKGYKQFMAERKQKSAWYVNLKRKVFGSKVKETAIPENLKELERDYDKSTIEYGRKMYADKKAELEKSGKSKEEQEKELAEFKQKEIFGKVIIEEQTKLNTLKAENLPPKEKALIRKAWDFYIKQPKATKIVVSTILAMGVGALVSPAAIAATGGILIYGGTKLVRGIIGAVAGPTAVIAYDKVIKERSTGRKKESLEKLRGEYKEDMSIEDIQTSRKEYYEILEKERISQRNRIIHKAIVGAAAGAGFSIAGGSIIHHLSPAQVLSGEVPTRPNISDHLKSHEIINHAKAGTGNGTNNGIGHHPGAIETVKPEQVDYSSRGAIQTIDDLKAKMKIDYPDMTKAPQNIQDFMKTDSTQEAIKLGMYNPNTAESMLVQKGTLSFDEHGNLNTHYVDMKGIEHDQILTKGNAVEQYKGDMFHSNSNSQPNATENGNNYSAPKQYNPETGQPMDNEPSNYNAPVQYDPTTHQPMDNTNIYDGNQTQVDPITHQPMQPIVDQHGTQNLNAQDTSVADKTNIENSSVIETAGLSAEKLAEVHTTYNSVIEHLFQDKASIQNWNIIKDSTQSYSAEKLMAWDETQVNDTFRPLIHDIKIIHQFTGHDPQPETMIQAAETPAEYIEHSLEKAALDGNLEELKEKLLTF